MNVKENSEVDQYTKHLKSLRDNDLADLVDLANEGARKQLQMHLIYKEAAKRFRDVTKRNLYEYERW